MTPPTPRTARPPALSVSKKPPQRHTTDRKADVRRAEEPRFPLTLKEAFDRQPPPGENKKRAPAHWTDALFLRRTRRQPTFATRRPLSSA